MIRVGETRPVSLEEAVPERVPIVRPVALTSGKIDGPKEADDVDERRSASGVVEVVEAPCVSCNGELLQVGIAVESHDRRVRHVSEDVADADGPGAIDEPKVREGVGSQAIEQIGRGVGQGGWFRPDLPSCHR